MRQINEQLVYSAGPTIFRAGLVIRDGGIRCSNGWLSIILDLVIKLEQRARTLPPNEQLNVQCIKEKFGGLRFYVDCHNKFDEIDITAAETKAWNTCEECGGQGKHYSDGWKRILCDPCVIKWKEERRHASRN